MYTNIFDTHTHYTDKAFDADRTELLQNFPAQGVSRVLLAGCTVQDSADSLQLAQQFPHVWSAAGVHPENASSCTRDWLAGIEKLARQEKVIAIGEIGLDYHYEGYDADLQKKIFAQQLELANSLHLPVIVHIRDAMGDALQILQTYRPAGVIHCWSGACEMAKTFVRMGMYLGFGGVTTFRNARKVVETLEWIPAESMLLETDCPYLAPVPFRGKRCDSRMIAYTAERAAEIRSTDPQELIDTCTANGCRLFGIA